MGELCACGVRDAGCAREALSNGEQALPTARGPNKNAHRHEAPPGPPTTPDGRARRIKTTGRETCSPEHAPAQDLGTMHYRGGGMGYCMVMDLMVIHSALVRSHQSVNC